MQFCSSEKTVNIIFLSSHVIIIIIACILLVQQDSDGLINCLLRMVQHQLMLRRQILLKRISLCHGSTRVSRILIRTLFLLFSSSFFGSEYLLLTLPKQLMQVSFRGVNSFVSPFMTTKQKLIHDV